MDVYINQGARRQIKALFMEEAGSSGLILGHKRGPRYIIESLFPFPEILTLSLKKHLEIIRNFDPDLIGYFSSGNEKAEADKIMAPFAAGMVFGRINIENRSLRFFQIDYNGRFVLNPLEISNEEFL